MDAYQRGGLKDPIIRDNGGIVIAIDDSIVYTDNNGKAEVVLRTFDPDLMRRNDFQQDALKYAREGRNFGNQYRVLTSMYGEGDTVFGVARSSRRYLGQISRGAGLNQRIESKRVRSEVSLQGRQGTPEVTDSNGETIVEMLSGNNALSVIQRIACLSGQKKTKQKSWASWG